MAPCTTFQANRHLLWAKMISLSTSQHGMQVAALSGVCPLAMVALPEAEPTLSCICAVVKRDRQQHVRIMHCGAPIICDELAACYVGLSSQNHTKNQTIPDTGQMLNKQLSHYVTHSCLLSKSNTCSFEK